MKTILSPLSFTLLTLVFFLGKPVFSQESVFKKNFTSSFAAGLSTTLEVNNFSGDITCINWEKNEVSIEAVITVKARTDKRAEFVIGNIGISQSGDSALKKYSTFINIEKLNKVLNTSSYEYRIDYTVKHPVYLNMVLRNKYGDISLAEISRKINIVLRYGNLSAKNISADDSKPLSKIDIGYGKATIEKLTWCNIELGHSTLKAGNCTGLILNSKYSDIKIKEIYSLFIVSKYDNINVTNCTNLQLESKYTNFDASVLKSDVNLNMQYGDCRITSIDASFRSLTITAKYANIDAFISAGACYSLSASVEFGTVKYSPKANITRKEGYTGEEAYGVVGCSGNPSSAVEVNAKFGDVDLIGNK